jgi:hypothetical protein
MTIRTWNIDRAVPILMTGGFFAHLINVSNYLANGHARIGEVLTWPVDFSLALVMIYCAIILIWRWRDIFAAFDIRSRPRQLGYWIITVYTAASVPGHVLFLTTGNTIYFDTFPWWFSLIIMPAYLVIMLYFLTLPHGPRSAA